jgi:uncharacterized protein (DUF58 family)
VIPSARLIWLVIGAGFPAALTWGLFPAAKLPALLAIGLIAAGAFFDALRKDKALAGIRVEFPPIARAIEGRDVILPIVIRNANGNARSIRLGFVAPDGVRTGAEERSMALPAQTPAVQLSWECTPQRRGRYRIEECFVEAESPFGLWTVRRRDPVTAEIRAYPSLREEAAFLAPRRGQIGLHALRQVGRGREFERLREYEAGDGLDDIHWKATARRGRPITKVFQVERTQEVYVVIDTSRLSGRTSGGQSMLDRAIKAALVAGASVERHGDLFGVAGFSQQVEAFVRARAGKTHYAACRDAIYELRSNQVSPDFDEIATFLRLRLRRRSLLLFLTALDDPLIAEQFTRATRLLAARHLVIAGIVRPPGAAELFSEENVESSRDVYRQLAGHFSWRKLRELESTLSRQGVRLAQLEPERFISGIVGVYDEVKQRQLI